MKTAEKTYGFTVVEILVAVFVIAIASTILASSLSSFRAAQDLAEAEANIIGVIKDARSRTLASDSNSNYGVHFESARTVLFKGGAYNALDPLNEIYILPLSVELNPINLAGGAVDTVFTRLLGTTTASGNISIRSKRNGSVRVITLEATGVVK